MKKQYIMKVEDINGRTIFKIPKLSQGSKQMLKVMGLGTVFFGALVFFIKFLIPIILKMVNQFLDLFHLYLNNLDNLNIRFLGGLIFLYIGWKVMSVVLYYWSKVIELILKEVVKK